MNGMGITISSGNCGGTTTTTDGFSRDNHANQTLSDSFQKNRNPSQEKRLQEVPLSLLQFPASTAKGQPFPPNQPIPFGLVGTRTVRLSAPARITSSPMHRHGTPPWDPVRNGTPPWDPCQIQGTFFKLSSLILHCQADV